MAVDCEQYRPGGRSLSEKLPNGVFLRLAENRLAALAGPGAPESDKVGYVNSAASPGHPPALPRDTFLCEAGGMAMKTITSSALVLGAVVCLSAPATAQAPVGALAIDERQGDQYGWAVDYETAAAAGTTALSECGSGCSVVLTFGRCAAYAADQDADSTAVGWAESFASADGARQAALGECGSRGGTGCIVRVWGCNSHVVEEGLGLGRAARRQVQAGLRAAGFDPGGADGMFGARTRAAIRSWQTSRGARATGYLDGASVSSLRLSQAVSTGRSAPAQPASPEFELVFWQSIANSTDPADFEAYLAQFPNGVFAALARNRLTALRRELPGAAGIPGPAVSVAVAGPAGRPADPASRLSADRMCAGPGADGPCWMVLLNRPGCYVWNPSRTGPAPGVTVTWTGECSGGTARGTGSLTWEWGDNRQAETGRLQGGMQTGHWVLREANGIVSEGPMVAGARNGHWVLRSADGGVQEGPYVAGEQTGHWVLRFADGGVEEGPVAAGARTGHWVLRFASGTVEEGSFVAGERHGDWVVRRADGSTSIHRFVNGERVEIR